MGNQRISQRYAMAFYDFAAERAEIELAYADLSLLSDVSKQNKELRLLLKNPVISPDKKIKILKAIFGDKISNTTASFLELLAKKRREEYIPQIAQAFIDIYRREKNIKVAEVTTAIALDNDLRKQLVALLEKQTSSEILLEEHIDPTTIGGIIIRIEGLKFDNTIRRKIQDLRQDFSVNMYIKAF